MKKLFSTLLLCATAMIIASSCSPKGTDQEMPVESVNLNKTTLSLVIGEMETLVATINPDEANSDITWTSSDNEVASVDTSGKVTAVKAGTATITVSSVENPDKKATCEVTVTPAGVPVTGISLNKTTLSLTIGKDETLTATIAPENASDKSVTWTSSDETIATVSTDGKVTAVKVGTATITATSVADNTKKATCEVTVTPAGPSVGSFYYSDNTYSTTFDNTKTCIGIIFWINPDDSTQGKIISLDDARLDWSTEKEFQNATYSENGSSNSIILQIRDGWENTYPALKWCTDKGEGWYLPAYEELKQAFRADLNTKLEAAGGTKFYLYFTLSSSEKDSSSAYAVDFSDGEAATFDKFNTGNVRAVLAF